VPASASEVAEVPAGLRYVPELISPTEERALLEAVEALPFRAVVMRGVAAKRMVVHFGWDYGYESWALTPAPEIPVFLHGLGDRAAALVTLPPEALAQVLVARSITFRTLRQNP